MRTRYVLYYIEEDKEIEIAKFIDKQLVFSHMKQFILDHKENLRNYVVLEKDKYIQYRNGNFVFRLYKLKEN